MERFGVGAVALLASTLAVPAFAAEVSQIESPTPGLNGPGSLDFPPNTVIEVFSPQTPLSFEGHFVDGLAEGEGLVRFPDVPMLPLEGQPPRSGPNHYLGTFKAGIPVGDGRLTITDLQYTQVIEGPYSGQQVSISNEGRTVAVYTQVPSKQETLVRLMQYPGWGAPVPSRIFFGRAEPTGVKGEWVDVPWYKQDGEIAIAGFGREIEVIFPDGGRMSCKGAPREADPPDLLQKLMGQTFPPIGNQRDASIDAQMYASSATCVTTNREGWSWHFTADHRQTPAAITYRECREPSGRRGTLRDGGRSCEERNRRQHDVLTNIGRELKRVLDRRILGTIDRAGGAMERAVCRATGTEPGKNCNISVQVGASWPVGDGPAPGLPANEQAARQAYLAAARRANRVSDLLSDDDPIHEAAALTAGANAICSALCATEGQRRYSDSLLSDLEAVAEQPITDDSVLHISRINRETASVLRAGLIVMIAAGPKFYDWVGSVDRLSRIEIAQTMVNAAPRGTLSNIEYLKRRYYADKVLEGLFPSTAHKAAVVGTEFLAASIQSNLKALRRVSPQRRTALSNAIAIRRTKKQVEDFLEKYKNIETEEELQDAIIAEALEPLGLTWPPPK